MVFVELPFHRAVEQLHIGIGKGREWRVNRDHATVGGGPSGQGACRVRGRGGGGCSLQKGATVDGTMHGEFLRKQDIESKRFPEVRFTLWPRACQPLSSWIGQFDGVGSWSPTELEFTVTWPTWSLRRSLPRRDPRRSLAGTLTRLHWRFQGRLLCPHHPQPHMPDPLPSSAVRN